MPMQARSPRQSPATASSHGPRPRTSTRVRCYGSGAETAIAPSTTWYLAEGATHGPFDLFYLLANTHDVAVDVDVTFLRAAPAAPILRRYVVQPRSRLTLWVDTLEPEIARSTTIGRSRTPKRTRQT